MQFLVAELTQPEEPILVIKELHTQFGRPLIHTQQLANLLG